MTGSAQAIIRITPLVLPYNAIVSALSALFSVYLQVHCEVRIKGLEEFD